MGFIDFLLQVGKAGFGFIGGIVGSMVGFIAVGGEQVAIGGVILIISLILMLYGAYSVRQLQRSRY